AHDHVTDVAWSGDGKRLATVSWPVSTAQDIEMHFRQQLLLDDRAADRVGDVSDAVHWWGQKALSVGGNLCRAPILGLATPLSILSSWDVELSLSDHSEARENREKLKVWDAETGRLVLTLQPDTLSPESGQGGYTGLALSHDGKLLAAIEKEVLRVWD